MRIVLPLLALAACAPTMEDQRPPFYKAWSGNGMCDGTTIADASGIVGSESGCEAHSSGWKVHRMSDASRARMKQAFDALPPPGDYCDRSAAGPGEAVTLSIYVDPGKPIKEWTYCGDARGQAEKFRAATTSLGGE